MPSRSSKSNKSSGAASGARARIRARAAGGSRLSTPVAARNRRATAWKGTWLVCDSQKTVNTSTSWASAIAETSRTRRLLPMPGEPTTPTTAPWPSSARPSKPATADISHCRPTRSGCGHGGRTATGSSSSVISSRSSSDSRAGMPVSSVTASRHAGHSPRCASNSRRSDLGQ